MYNLRYSNEILKIEIEEVSKAIIRFNEYLWSEFRNVEYNKRFPDRTYVLEDGEAFNIYEATSEECSSIIKNFDLFYVCLNIELASILDLKRTDPKILFRAAINLISERIGSPISHLVNRLIFHMVSLELIHDYEAYKKVQHEFESIVYLDNINHPPFAFMQRITKKILSEHVKPSKGLDDWLLYHGQNQVIDILNSKFIKNPKRDINNPVTVFHEKITPLNYLIEKSFFTSFESFKLFNQKHDSFNFTSQSVRMYADYYFMTPQLIKLHRLMTNKSQLDYSNIQVFNNETTQFFDLGDTVFLLMYEIDLHKNLKLNKIIELKPFMLVTFRKNPLLQEPELRKILSLVKTSN